jgi:hypothetical protein
MSKGGLTSLHKKKLTLAAVGPAKSSNTQIQRLKG